MLVNSSEREFAQATVCNFITYSMVTANSASWDIPSYRVVTNIECGCGCGCGWGWLVVVLAESRGTWKTSEPESKTASGWLLTYTVRD